MPGKKKRIPDAKAEATSGDNIVYCTFMSNGYGDFRHLVRLMDAQKLMQFPVPVNSVPIILIAYTDQPGTLEFVVNSLLEKGYIKSQSKFPTATAGIVAYLTKLYQDNPHFHMVPIDPKTFFADAQSSAGGKKVGAEIDRYINKSKTFRPQLNKTTLIVAASLMPPTELNNLSVPMIDFHEYKPSDMPGCLRTRNMGIGTNCDGIFIDKRLIRDAAEKLKTFSAISNAQYLANFTDHKSETVEPSAIGTAFNRSLKIPSYLQGEYETAVFIHSITISASYKKHSVVTFYVNGEHFNKALLKRDKLVQHGFSEIVYYQNGVVVREQLPGATGNRQLRIFYNYVFNDDDYAALYRTAGSNDGAFMAGCSGDTTLDQCISFDLIPFCTKKRELIDSLYEVAVKLNADDSVKQFIMILQQVSDVYHPENPESTDYIKINSISYFAIELAKAIDNPKFLPEWQRMMHEVRTNHAINDKLERFFVIGIIFNKLQKAFSLAISSHDNVMVWLSHLSTNEDWWEVFYEAILRKNYFLAVFVDYHYFAKNTSSLLHDPKSLLRFGEHWASYFSQCTKHLTKIKLKDGSKKRELLGLYQKKPEPLQPASTAAASCKQDSKEINATAFSVALSKLNKIIATKGLQFKNNDNKFSLFGLRSVLEEIKKHLEKFDITNIEIKGSASSTSAILILTLSSEAIQRLDKITSMGKEPATGTVTTSDAKFTGTIYSAAASSASASLPTQGPASFSREPAQQTPPAPLTSPQVTVAKDSATHIGQFGGLLKPLPQQGSASTPASNALFPDFPAEPAPNVLNTLS